MIDEAYLEQLETAANTAQQQFFAAKAEYEKQLKPNLQLWVGRYFCNKNNGEYIFTVKVMRNRVIGLVVCNWNGVSSIESQTFGFHPVNGSEYLTEITREEFVKAVLPLYAGLGKQLGLVAECLD